MLVGRDRQRAAIDAAITRGLEGRSAALAFSGPPGIGKTSLLGYAAGRADGMALLRARGIESEAQIPFASLLELLRPALGLLNQLAAPQAAALEQAFALRPGRAQDRFAVAAATLGLLAACAEQQQLMLVLDDIQWFDAPSSEALRFALRRLDADPLVAILAVRSGHRSLLDGTEIETVELDGLSEAEARLLRSDLPDAAMQRLIVATDGNPLALLQLAPDARVRAIVGRLPAPRRRAR
jgi:predicted ATPase